MPGTALQQRLSRPENDSQIRASWERFMNGQEVGSDALRRLIDDSWQRCHGEVDPRRDGAPPPAQGDALYDLLTDNDELVQASSAVTALARDFLFETGTVMVLTDATGAVLNVEGTIPCATRPRPSTSCPARTGASRPPAPMPSAPL